MVVLQEVPEFAAQIRGDDCGSVALASLLTHAGFQVPVATIDQYIFDPIIGGSLLPMMENFVIDLGAKPQTGRGDLKFLRTRIVAGKPVLLPIDLGWGAWRRAHYVVVFGFGPENFLLHERQGKTVIMKAAELKQRWQKMGFLFLYLDG